MRVKIHTAAMTILISALTVIILVAVFAYPDYDFEEVTYTVKQGDSLWYISGKYCPDGMDRHDYIELVVKRNNLVTTNIDIGQRLTVYNVRD